jgi:general secretion pathway protein F
MLSQGGIPLTRALASASGVVHQPALAVSLQQASLQISEGQRIAESLQQTGLVEEIGFRLIRAGERSGEIGKMFENLADYYDRQTERTIERLARLLEPTLMLFIGLIVGMVVLALYMPIFELASSLD